MPTTLEKLNKAKDAYAKLVLKLKDKNIVLNQGTEGLKKPEALIEGISKLEKKIADLNLEIEGLELQHDQEEHKEQEVGLQKRSIELYVKKLKINDPKTLDELEAIALEVIRIKVEKKLLSAREKANVELLKALTRAYPAGWTENEDVYKKYLFLRLGQTLVVLQDNPEYNITFEKLVELIGIDQAKKYAKVDKTTLVDNIAKGLVKRVDSEELFTHEDWEANRIRSEREPKVDIRDSQKAKKVKAITLSPELFVKTIDELQGMNGITGHEINPLKKIGLVTIGDLLRYSGEQLLSIDQIGPVRAVRIFQAIALHE